MPEKPEIESVELTGRAKSKAFRLIPAEEIKRIVREVDGLLYFDHPGESYVLKVEWDNEWVHIIFYVNKNDDAVVITQTHRHENLEELDSHELLGDYRGEKD